MTDVRGSTTTTLRLLPEERAALEVAAAEAGVGPSTFARIAAMRAAGRRVSPTRRKRTNLAQAIAGVLGELGRLGSNVNQVAKHANRTGDVADLAEIRGELERLTRAVLALREVAP